MLIGLFCLVIMGFVFLMLPGIMAASFVLLAMVAFLIALVFTWLGDIHSKAMSWRP